jgi:hypothetical protein
LLFVPKPVRGGFWPWSKRRNRERREAFYHAFRAWAAGHIGGPMPEVLGDGYFLYFESEPAWTGRVLPFRQPPEQHALHEVLARFARDTAYKPLGWRPLWERIVIWSVLGILLLFVGLLVFGLLFVNLRPV